MQKIPKFEALVAPDDFDITEWFRNLECPVEILRWKAVAVEYTPHFGVRRPAFYCMRPKFKRPPDHPVGVASAAFHDYFREFL